MTKRTKVTESYLKSHIVNEEYLVLPDGRTTICMLTMVNGFTVRGESSCVSKENFVKDLGEGYAFADALNNAWAFEGYLLAEELNPDPEKIARLCHEVNRAYCRAMDDDSQPPWDEAPDWQRDSAIRGVENNLLSNLTPEESHNLWMMQKEEEGWKYGPVKNPEKKEHPCFAPYNQLPVEQKAKDHLFQAIVGFFKR